jgi:hypothetical protein
VGLLEVQTVKMNGDCLQQADAKGAEEERQERGVQQKWNKLHYGTQSTTKAVHISHARAKAVPTSARVSEW